MERRTVSAESQREYDRVANLLAAELGATAGHMMGMPTLYLGGKGFAGMYGDAMVFKLVGEDHAAAIGLPGATLFDPSGLGRPMKAWVQLPLQHSSEWPRFARAGARGIGNA
ncbi:MAG: hypothetical protein ACHQ01_03800 [Candidatus Limnocylindrales bacterium]